MKNGGFLRAFILAGIVLLLPFTASTLSAQVASGTIVGTARDSSGAIVPGANITSKSVETGVTRNVVSGELGAYTISALPVGTYDLRRRWGASGLKFAKGSASALALRLP